MDKATEMSRLVQERKGCRLCAGLANPAEVDAGMFDSDRIGPYTRWQGNIDAQLMVVARDFAPVEKFREFGGWPGERVQTNLRLVDLLAEAGFRVAPPRSGSSDDQVFFTNAVLCLPGGTAMRTKLRREWFRNCGSRFLRRTIEVVQPRAVAALGTAALDTILVAFGQRRCADFRSMVETSCAVSLANTTQLFAVYHPATTARSRKDQAADWRRLGDAARARRSSGRRNMKKTFAILALILTGCSSTGVVPTGQDAYMVAKTGGAPGTSGAEVTADLYREANAFCADQKKQLITVNVTELDWKPFVRLANSKLEFRCVVEGTAK
jgi:DNA polymerase